VKVKVKVRAKADHRRRGKGDRRSAKSRSTVIGKRPVRRPRNLSLDPRSSDLGRRPQAAIPGVLLQPLARAEDSRGWLTELFRSDVLEGAGMKEAQPVMGYVSMTLPGVARGPHEHREQTDLLVFAGPSDFEVTLWDNRTGSSTFGRRETFVLGASNPATLITPPGVVHSYRNVGKGEGWVLNFPNRLYKGPGRREPVDEIRYEDDPESPYRLEEGKCKGKKAEAGAKLEVKAKVRVKVKARQNP
jgi:dTDP-4-dehydrorhamnose 3,5-epimerase